MAKQSKGGARKGRGAGAGGDLGPFADRQAMEASRAWQIKELYEAACWLFHRDTTWGQNALAMLCGYPDMRLRMLALENRAGIADFNCLYEWLLAEPAIQEGDASVPAGDLVLRRAPLELSARVRDHIRDLIGSHLSLFTIVEAKAARLVVLDRLNEAAKPEAVASIYGASAFSGMEMQGWDGLAPGDLAGLRIIGGGADRPSAGGASSCRRSGGLPGRGRQTGI